MTPEETSAAKIQIIDEYNRTMSDLATIKNKVMAKYMGLAEREIEEESGRIRSEFGRVLARNPLPVREKQRLSKSTSWPRYRSWIEASGEMDVSSREAKREREKGELLEVKNPVEDKIHVEEVTEKALADDRYQGWVNYPQISVTWDSQWFVASLTPGGKGTLWAVEQGKAMPVFTVPAGDDEWTDLGMAEDPNSPTWADERAAVMAAYEEEEAF